MRALVPVTVAHADAGVDVHEHYAADWLGSGGLRVNFVSSVDGGVAVAGKSAGLQTPGDNVVFAALRDLADVVLVGGGTATAEGYAPVELDVDRRERRRALGLSPRLPTAVLSGHLHLDPAAALFHDAPEDNRTIVITSEAGDVAVRERLEAQGVDVAICGADAVDLPTARRALEQRGITRILCEGGPGVFADLASAGVVDELCLTISPTLAGPGAGRIVSGDEWEAPARGLRLTGLLEEDGALFARYRLPPPQQRPH